MNWHLWLAYFAAAWLIALSPGSGAVLSVMHGSQYGVRQTSVTILGLQAGLLVILLIAGLGVGSLLLASETAFWLVKLAGALYLAYIGVRQWLSPHGMMGPETLADKPHHITAMQRFSRGFLTNVTNPKGIVFMVAVLPQFINPSQPLALQLLILALTTLFADVVVMHGYALGGRSLRAVLKSPRVVRWQNRLFGGLFVLLGLSLLFVRRGSAA